MPPQQTSNPLFAYELEGFVFEFLADLSLHPYHIISMD